MKADNILLWKHNGNMPLLFDGLYVKLILSSVPFACF